MIETSHETDVSVLAVLHFAAAALWVLISIMIEVPIIGVVIGLGAIAMHTATVWMLGGWPGRALMWSPLLNAVALLMFVRSDQWDCYPDCGEFSGSVTGVLRFGLFLFVVGAAAAPLLAIRRALQRHHARGS